LTELIRKLVPSNTHQSGDLQSYISAFNLTIKVSGDSVLQVSLVIINFCL